MKYLIISLVVISGCARAPSEIAPQTNTTQYQIPGGAANEFKLNDGTRCVTLNGYKQGGITCEWRPQ